MSHHHDDDLRIFHPLYAIAISVGLLKVAEAVFNGWKEQVNGSLPLKWAIVVTVLAVALLPVAIRMTWAVESLSRYIAANQALDNDKSVSPLAVTLWHYPALLAHAFLVFILSRTAALIADPSVTGDAVFPFFAVFAGLLLFNSVYLFSVIPNEEAAAAKDQSKRLIDSGRVVKITWILNNYVFACLIAFVLIYHKLAEMSLSDNRVLSLLITLMVLNSVLDLVLTAKYYVPRGQPNKRKLEFPVQHNSQAH